MGFGGLKVSTLIHLQKPYRSPRGILYIFHKIFIDEPSSFKIHANMDQHLSMFLLLMSPRTLLLASVVASPSRTNSSLLKAGEMGAVVEAATLGLRFQCSLMFTRPRRREGVGAPEDRRWR
jgi:hypothetical protein